MSQELLDSFKVKHEADEIGTATSEEIAAWGEYLNEVGSEAAITFLGGEPKARIKARAKKAKK